MFDLDLDAFCFALGYTTIIGVVAFIAIGTVFTIWYYASAAAAFVCNFFSFLGRVWWLTMAKNLKR